MSRSRRCAALFALSTLQGLPAAAAPDDPRVYEAGELAPGRYEVVGRLWVDGARSAFSVPAHADAAAAVSELKTEAARRGADGLVNVACFTDGGTLWGGPHFCYALAVRRK